MEKFKAFCKRKNIEVSAKRYGIDALGAMAQGLFCSLLIGTIIKTLGAQLGVPFLTDIGTYAMSVSGPAMAIAIGYALQAPPMVLFSLAAVGHAANAEASVCERPVSQDEILSYSDKYLGGSKSSKGMASTKRVIPADISTENTLYIQELAVRAFKALGCCGVARIDFMIDNDSKKIYLNEINTIPGSLSFYLWEPKGVKYTQLLSRMIDLALKREREQEKVTYTFDTNVLAAVKLGGTKGAKGAKL